MAAGGKVVDSTGGNIADDGALQRIQAHHGADTFIKGAVAAAEYQKVVFAGAVFDGFVGVQGALGGMHGELIATGSKYI